MYPFSTNNKTIFLKLSNDEIVSRLEKHVEASHFFQIREDFKFYGKIKSNFAKFELGQNPTRNSFRPVVILNWKENGDMMEINCYCRLDYSCMIMFFIIPILGTLISFEIGLVIPFILMAFLYVFLIFGLFQIVYRLSKKFTLKKIDEILDDLGSITIH